VNDDARQEEKVHRKKEKEEVSPVFDTSVLNEPVRVRPATVAPFAFRGRTRGAGLRSARTRFAGGRALPVCDRHGVSRTADTDSDSDSDTAPVPAPAPMVNS
jgi:hypothetical protein